MESDQGKFVYLSSGFDYLHLRSDFPKIIVFLLIKLSGSDDENIHLVNPQMIYGLIAELK